MTTRPLVTLCALTTLVLGAGSARAAEPRDETRDARREVSWTLFGLPVPNLFAWWLAESSTPPANPPADRPTDGPASDPNG